MFQGQAYLAGEDRGVERTRNSASGSRATSGGIRWMLRLIWELRDDPAGFRELQRRCEQMSSSVLSTRLNELTEAGIVHADEGRYRLTPLGKDLVEALRPLWAWADDWAEALSPRGAGR